MTVALPRIFVVVVALFGVLTAFLLPPVQAPDEATHLLRSVMVAKGNFFPRQEGGQLGQDVPTSLIHYANSHQYMLGRMDLKYSYARWYADSHQPANFEDTTFTTYGAQNGSPFVYAPQAIGITAARVAHSIAPVQLPFSWPAAQYGARLGNLALYIIVGCASIAYVNRYRLIAFAAATLPVVVQQAVSAGYDALILATALGFFALLTGLLERHRGPNLRETVLLVFCSFVLGHLKIAYAPLLVATVLLYRVMPLRPLLMLVGGMAIVSLFGAGLTALFFGLPSDAARELLYAAQIAWLGDHVLSIPRLVLGSIYHSQGLETIGYFANFGSIDTNWTLPALVIPALALVTAWLGDATKGPSLLQLRGGAIVYLGVAASITAFYIATYIVWTSIIQADGVGAEYVNGVQGRYFLPLTPFVLAPLAVLPRWLAIRTAPAVEDLTLAHVALVCLGLTMMLFAIVLRFWVPAPQ